MTLTRTLCLLGLAAAPALAQDDPDAVLILAEGDTIPGVGLVTRIDNLVVANGGGTAVEADTDNANTDADTVLIEDGVLVFREGQTLAAPAGATLDAFDSLTLDAAGNSGWNFFLDGTAGNSDDSGLYWNGTLLIQEGDVCTAPELSPGTPWIGFSEVDVDAAGNLIVVGAVDDPAIPSTVDRVLVRVETDGAGNVLGETVLRKEGDVFFLQTETVADIETGPHTLAVNASGSVISVSDLTGDTAADFVVAVDDFVVAQEGMFSPVLGRKWSNLDGAEVGLNDAGAWVVHGTLDGDPASDRLIAWNFVKLVQEGDVLPGTNGFPITSFGTGPVSIGNTGNILWYGDWADPDGDVDTGLFLNDFLLVQEGVTTVNGVVVDSLRGITDGYGMSPDGQWVLYEALLANGDEVVVRVFVGPWTFLGDGLAGQGGRTPQLRGRGTLAAGSMVTLELTDARPLGTTNLVIGISALNAPFKGGTLVPNADILLPGLPVDANGALSISFPFPAGTPAGVGLWYQHWVDDVDGPLGFAASNAVRSTTP